MANFAFAGYSAAGLLFALLAALLLIAWKGRLGGGLLLIASGTTVAWAVSGAVATYFKLDGSAAWHAVFEIARTVAWILFLSNTLGFPGKAVGRQRAALRLTAIFTIALSLTLLLMLALPRSALPPPIPHLGPQFFFAVFLLFALVGLVLTEQLYRYTPAEHRWAIKYLCLGVGVIFVYDFYLYADALLFQRVDTELWAARGAVQSMAVPLIAMTAARNPDWSVEVFVSRHMVFHSVVLSGAGLYLLLMAAAGYYVRSLGGEWGRVLQITFLFGAVILLLALFSSAQVRARLRVFLGKHFFRNKYDYRQEWLGFTDLLTSSSSRQDLNRRVLQGVADAVESTGGQLWLRDRDTGDFGQADSWVMPLINAPFHADSSTLVTLLQQTGWVVDIDEYRREPERYNGVELPPWLGSLPRAWLVVPLLHQQTLLGFIVLAESRTGRDLNWEDFDLLKTLGQQAAGYVALVEANEALAQAEQFEAFNRLSAYVVHDLKNVGTQLSLVVSNAHQHMDNPGFLRDAIETIEDVLGKINRMSADLRKQRLEPERPEPVDLEEVVRRAATARASGKPTPTVSANACSLVVHADRDRTQAILEHLIQNAQEATPQDGQVELRLLKNGEWAVVKITDTGCGMDPDFVRDRLFKPFDTTKGNAGMGIGVFECRQFVRSHGGRIDVESQPGKGTTFRIRLPLAQSTRSQSDSTLDTQLRMTKSERRKLLIIEDDRSIQKQLRWAFTDYQVLTAGDRTPALEIVRRHRPAVITLDLGLPPDPTNASEGMLALEEILTLSPHAKVIVVTGNDDTSNAVRAVAMGACDFYQKPIDAQVLGLIVERNYRLFELEEENRRLAGWRERSPLEGIIAASSEMLRVCRMVEKVAPTNASVLLLGESGTGKELMARALHGLSPRKRHPFVAINCAAIPETLLESELFGYEKGAFTGANKTTPGKIESADGGTLFLDEIGDLPHSLQPKLLRFLQERTIERVGGRQAIAVDVRVICATHQALSQLIGEQKFREDLFYRVNEITLEIPPLRERSGDAMLLARALLEKHAEEHGRSLRGFTQEALTAIETHPWPGNVRELENRVKRSVIMAEGKRIGPEDLELTEASEKETTLNLRKLREQTELDALTRAMALAQGNVSQAATILGISRPTLYDLMGKYGLARQR